MLIGSFCDQVIEELGYTTQDKGLDRRNVIVRADAIRTEMISHLVTGATLVSESARVGIVSQRELNDTLYISRVVPIAFNPVRGRFFANMPTEYLNFNEYSGIRAVRGLQANTTDVDVPVLFFHQRVGAGVAYGQLESATLMGGIGFEVEGMKIWFNNMPAGSYPNALITYIPSLLGLTEEDILPCSGEFTKMLMDRTKEAFMLKRQTPEDKTADSRSE